MSDNQYFLRLWNGEAKKALTIYSDKAYRLSDLFFPNGGYDPSKTTFNMNEYLLEYEVSPQYIVGNGSFGNLVSRTVYRGDFQFSGNELVSGTVSEVIQVGSNGEIRGYRIASPIKVIPSSAESSGLPSISALKHDKSIYDAATEIKSKFGASTEITTTQGYEQFFPPGWSNRPFQDNLVSVGKTSSGSGSSSGSGGSSTTQTLTTTSSVDTLTGIKKTKDIFKFDADPNGQVDKVTGFNAKEKDILSISKSAFEIDKGTFAVAKNAKTLAKQLGTSVDIVYYQKKGELILNANGAEPGYGDDGGVFAVLMGRPTVGAGSVEFY
jgi:hypothetical protein